MAWKMRQSPLCDQLYIAPGNAGTALEGNNLAVEPNDFSAVKKLVLEKNIGLVVVGPEEPLVRGIEDFFVTDADLSHIPVLGPSAEGARLEGSKAFAKAFMQEFDIPTAAYREFTADTLEEGLAYLTTQQPPFVLKADGLAAGKGVLILDSVAEAQAELRSMLGGKFGAASATVVIEQFLKGIEFSVFAITDGKDYQILPVAKDYKRIGEGDTGLNTGGMGAISPLPFVDATLMKKVETRIIRPTIDGIRQRGIRYHGFVFFGLIAVEGEPFVIEYNCRMGDPETEVVLPRLNNDLVALTMALFEGQLGAHTIVEDSRAAATVVLVSGGYPGDYEKGKIITGLDQVEGSLVFHAGTKQETESVTTNGGRVLAITSYGDTFPEALAISNRNAGIIEFAGKYFRKDLGFDL
jgi:phosphoribosylamine--glycine ligase